MTYHVTDVLSMLSDFSRVPNGTMEEARRIGTETHRYSLGWIANPDLSFSTSDPVVAPYVEKVKAWFSDYVTEVVAVEKPFVWNALGLTGRIDLICVMRGDMNPSIVDLKRVCSVSKIAALQTAAYQQGAKECLKIHSRRRFALHVPLDGPCKAVEFDSKADWPAFTHALILFKYLISSGALKPPKERL